MHKPIAHFIDKLNKRCAQTAMNLFVLEFSFLFFRSLLPVVSSFFFPLSYIMIIILVNSGFKSICTGIFICIHRWCCCCRHFFVLLVTCASCVLPSPIKTYPIRWDTFVSHFYLHFSYFMCARHNATNWNAFTRWCFLKKSRVQLAIRIS